MKNNTPDNFGGLPDRYSDYDNARIAILPVPFDETSSWIRGADRGPAAIINASKHMELYDIETSSEVYRQGIHTAKPVIADDPAEMVEHVYRRTRKMIDDGKFVVTIGGEHTVSLGAIRAHASAYDDFSILHLDAHSDRRDSYEGEIYSHACVMARAAKITKNILSVGIRSMDSSELDHIEPAKIFYASRIAGSREWINEVLQQLTPHVYVTVDLDVFDPSLMPSTGTPEPGGMGWYDVIDLLTRVMNETNVVGFDVVELCPSENVAPDFLAAKLLYKLLSIRLA